MASEPERPIEKLLRDAAQKRRDEAPASFEPHPATRRMLQGEVARRYPQEGHGAGRRFDWFWRIAPRLSWTVGSLAVVICVWVLSPRSSHKDQERLFVRNEPAATTAPPPIAAPVVATERRLQPAATSDESASSATLAKGQPSLVEKELSITPAPGAPSVAPAREGLASVAQAKKAQPGVRYDFTQAGTSVHDIATIPSLPLAMAEQKVKSEPISTDVSSAFADKPLPAPQVPGVVQSKDNEPANRISGLASANRPTPSTAAAWAKPAVPAPGQNMTPPPEMAFANASGLALQVVTNSIPPNVALAQHFVRNIPASKTLAAQSAHPIDQRLLVSFQVEQNGAELRVKDEDGSVYFGYVQPAQTAAVLHDAVKAVPATAGRTGNPKLNDVQAHLESAPPAPQTFFFRVTGTNQTLKLPVLFTGNISNVPGHGLSPTQLSGARISGRVRVGTQREFEVLASPR